jgi:hypothetical protein
MAGEDAFARCFSVMSTREVNAMGHEAKDTPRPPLKTIDDLLEYWRVRITMLMDAHLHAVHSLTWRNFWLGGTATILAAIVSSSIFATLQDSVATGIRVAVGSVSLLSASLIGLKTYLKYGERVEAHRRVGRRYGALVHWITELQATPPSEPQLRECVERIRRTFDEIDLQSPNVSNRIWKRTVAAVEQEVAGEVTEAVRARVGLFSRLRGERRQADHRRLARPDDPSVGHR